MTYEEFKNTDCGKYLLTAQHDFRDDDRIAHMLFADLYFIFHNGWHIRALELFDLFQKNDFEAIKKIYNYEDCSVFTKNECENSFLVLLYLFMNEHAKALVEQITD